VTNWYGSHEISLSDHTNIILKVGDLQVTRLTYCNPQEKQVGILKVNVGVYQELYTC